jgi:hypothetical protein
VLLDGKLPEVRLDLARVVHRQAVAPMESVKPQRGPARSSGMYRRYAAVPLSVTRHREVSPTGHCSENLIAAKQRPRCGR